ncbi:hypothetical protein [Paraburkholderia sediminicola]|uniref:hypothetical protein n=1 Tax=Paraburkholderia sediminicola TaxID=458836 RepID=UPI0038BAC7F7
MSERSAEQIGDPGGALLQFSESAQPFVRDQHVRRRSGHDRDKYDERQHQLGVQTERA